MDVHEDEKSNTVTASFELPGLKKEDVNIDIHNNVLTVSGETKVSSEHDENGYAVRERRYGKFSRSIPLPQGIKVSLLSLYSPYFVSQPLQQPEEVKAGLENGVLNVTFPKSSPEQAPKRITVS